MCVIEHHQTDKFGMVSGQIAGERNDILSLFISASRINLLRGSRFSSNGKARHSGSGRGSAIAYHAAQSVTNFLRGFRRNDLAQHDRGKRTDRLAFRGRNRFHDAWHD
jgi:hypothetical protein